MHGTTVLCASLVALLLCLVVGAETGTAQTTTATTAYGWGRNLDGELGIGSKDFGRRAPVQVVGLSGVKAMTGGGGFKSSFSLALKNDGTVWAWGNNFYGQLGDGTGTARTTPTQVAGLSGVEAVAAGRYHGLALKTDGTVWAWGHGYFGQTGNGANELARRTPTQVTGLSGVVAIAAGGYFNLALKGDGTVWSWGRNYAGELGDGTNAHKNVPTQVGRLPGAKAISAGGVHGMALGNDGSVWSWGSNDEGQLGNGTTTNTNAPVQVSGLSSVRGISAGTAHSLAHMGDGTVRSWGGNDYGQLGDGTNAQRNTPTAVVNLGSVKTIDAGHGHNVVVREDGTAWAWGLKANGQLGDGSPPENGWNPQSNVPVKVQGLSNVTSASAGMGHSLAVGTATADTAAAGTAADTVGQVSESNDAPTASDPSSAEIGGGEAPSAQGPAGPDLPRQPDPTPSVDRASEAKAQPTLIVKFEEGSRPAAREDVRSDEGLEKEENLDLIDAEVASVEGQSVEQAVRDLERRPEVEYAEPNFPVQAADYADEPRFGKLWGLRNTGQTVLGASGVDDVDIDAEQAAAVTRGDANLVVAVVDEGVDFSHPDLAERAWTNPGESGAGKETNGVDDDGNGYVDDVNGWYLSNNVNTVYDPRDDAHGTHVAGTIAASADGQGVVGVAPNVKVASLKFLSFGTGYTDNAIKAIEYAKRMGIKISNNSWGCNVPGECYSQALEEAIRNSGQLFVAAAGNSSNNNDTTPAYPASYDLPNVVSVAAADSHGYPANFTNYGQRSVDISAPGVNVLSSVPAAPRQPAPALVLTAAGPGTALTAGFGVDAMGDEAGDAARQASFMGKALGSVGRVDEQVVLVDDDLSQDGNRNVGPDFEAAIRSATNSAPEVVDVPFGSDGPPLSSLRGKTVVWATGQTSVSEEDDFRYSKPALTDADKATLASFLNGGGRLILMGWGSLYGPWNEQFAADVLKVRAEAGNTTFFSGSGGTAFAGESSHLTVQGPFGSTGATLTPLASSATVQGVYLSWEYKSGTSMAAPHVTGVAALAASVDPALLADPAALKGAVLRSGEPLPNGPTTATGEMVNARAAVVPDVTPPDTSIASGPSGPTNRRSASFGFSSTEAGSRFECSLDGAVFASCSPPASYAELADGAHAFRVRAIDEAGNPDTAPAERAWTVDTARPTVGGLRPANGSSTRDRTPLVGATVRDSVTEFTKGNVRLFLDGRSVTAFSYDGARDLLSYTRTSNLSYGTHTVKVEARDAAGNVTARGWSFKVVR